MDHAAINKRLSALRAELEDLEETFCFNLTHTSAHLGSGMVADHEDEIAHLKEKIRRLEGMAANQTKGVDD